MTDIDMAPPPEDVLEIRRAPSEHGWYLCHDGQPYATFSTAADLAEWIKTHLTLLDVEAGIIPRGSPPETAGNDPLPIMFKHPPQAEPRRRIWRILRGGKL